MKILLNIGSGQRPFSKPWINVDCQARWAPDLVARGESLPMFADASVEMICLHHVVEHYGCNEAKDLLLECLRLLSPTGSLLIFVPDMWALAGIWREGRIDDPTYMINVYGAYMGDEADRHKFGYTRVSIMRLLKECGFGSYGPFNWRPVEGADIAKDDWILGVEAHR